MQFSERLMFTWVRESCGCGGNIAWWSSGFCNKQSSKESLSYLFPVTLQTYSRLNIMRSQNVLRQKNKLISKKLNCTLKHNLYLGKYSFTSCIVHQVWRNGMNECRKKTLTLVIGSYCNIYCTFLNIATAL